LPQNKRVQDDITGYHGEGLGDAPHTQGCEHLRIWISYPDFENSSADRLLLAGGAKNQNVNPPYRQLNAIASSFVSAVIGFSFTKPAV